MENDIFSATINILEGRYSIEKALIKLKHNINEDCICKNSTGLKDIIEGIKVIEKAIEYIKLDFDDINKNMLLKYVNESRKALCHIIDALTSIEKGSARLRFIENAEGLKNIGNGIKDIEQATREIRKSVTHIIDTHKCKDIAPIGESRHNIKKGLRNINKGLKNICFHTKQSGFIYILQGIFNIEESLENIPDIEDMPHDLIYETAKNIYDILYNIEESLQSIIKGLKYLNEK